MYHIIIIIRQEVKWLSTVVTSQVLWVEHVIIAKLVDLFDLFDSKDSP